MHIPIYLNGHITWSSLQHIQQEKKELQLVNLAFYPIKTGFLLFCLMASPHSFPPSSHLPPHCAAGMVLGWGGKGDSGLVESAPSFLPSSLVGWWELMNGKRLCTGGKAWVCVPVLGIGRDWWGIHQTYFECSKDISNFSTELAKLSSVQPTPLLNSLFPFSFSLLHFTQTIYLSLLFHSFLPLHLPHLVGGSSSAFGRRAE